MSAFLRDLAPLAQTNPEIVQAMDARQMLDEYARYRNVVPSVIRSQEALDAENQQKAEQQEMQMTAQAAPQVSSAIKDIAQAKQVDPEGVGQLLNI
jgi:uncharacterized protein YktA (UPF0223 family)